MILKRRDVTDRLKNERETYDTREEKEREKEREEN